MALRAKFKFSADPSYAGGRDALRCLMTASALGIELDFHREKSVEEPQLIIDDDHCPILSSYAITRYLLLQSKNESFLKSHSNPATMWTIDSYVLWALNHLRRAIDSVDKNVIHQVLITLDETLFGSKSGFLVGDSLTLADIFVWSSIYTSRIYSNAIEFLDSHPETKNYITLISSTPSAQAALHILFDGDLTTSHRRIVPIDSPKEKFYLTTAINYTNGSPHIGHAYEAICSDVICRYHRIYGRDVFFLTGTDEHGQKIAQTAEKMGMSPIEICDLYSKQFKELNLSLNISNDFFIRTTTHEHKAIAQNVWKLSQAKGDIYLDTYTGWYNIREETFITEFEAQASDYKDPMSGVPLQKMEEVSYFFKMSKYQQALIDHINNHPEFIQPDFRRNEILARLKEPLTDLSTSRTTFSWGVPVPGDESHVMYVWFDALTNYLSGVGYTTCNLLSRFWPADVHVIGKDITWFHCVIWPCILMSAGIALPKTVFAHGFVVAGDGRKMSKSLGNVIEPLQLIKQFPNADTFRFYTVKGACFGRDLRFDLDAMNDCHNSDLADTLGNLVHRATGLCQKYCNGYIPDCPLPDGEPPFNFDSAAQSMDLLMRRFCLQEASEIAMQACRDTNKYLTDRAPWAVSDVVEKQKICRALVEAVYILAHLFEPFIPISADEIFKRLGTPRSHLRSLSGWFDNLKPGTSINVGEVLFVKREAKPDKDGAASSPKKEEKKGNKTNGNSVIH